MGRIKTVQISTGTSAGTVTGIDGTATAKSADYTVTDADRVRTILMTTGASDRTVTLPTAADNTNRIITVKKVDSGTGIVIIDGEGSEQIDTSPTVRISDQLAAVTVQCDGTAWYLLSTMRCHTAKGTAVTASTAVTNTAFTNLATNVTLTFTADMSGKYLIRTHVQVDQPAAGTNWGLRLNNSSGSAVAYWNPHSGTTATIQNEVPTGSGARMTVVERIDILNAGTSYTYDLQARSSSGAVSIRGDRTDAQIVATFVQ